MPAKDSTLVRLPNPLVARLDASRGDVARSTFLDALLDAYERGDIVAPETPPERKVREHIEERGREIGAELLTVADSLEGVPAAEKPARVIRNGEKLRREVTPNFKKEKKK